MLSDSEIVDWGITVFQTIDKAVYEVACRSMDQNNNHIVLFA